MTFETFLTAGRPDPRTTRAASYALALAVALHAAGLLGALVHASWRVDELSPPNVPVSIFALPNLPPPPPPAGSRRRTITERRRTSAAVQPRQDRVVPRDQPVDEPPGKNEGVKDGEKGGVRNGVIGGHGTDPAPEPARFVTPNVATGQLAVDPQADAHRVTLPAALSRAGMRLWALARICMNRKGEVEQVTLLRGADPTVDPLIVAALRTWRYRPYAIDGRPVPFCTNVRYEISAR